MLCWKKNNKGFTLLELLIAISIMAVLSGMGYVGLSSILKTKEAIEEEGDNLNQLQKIFLIVGRDVHQIVARNIRENDNLLPALSSSKGNRNIVEFTRNGFVNSTNKPRSNLQRVAYRLKENNFYRVYWPNLDRVGNEIPVEQLLSSEVIECRVDFLDYNGRWIDTWPKNASLSISSKEFTLLPRAVNITLVFKQWGKVNRIYPLVGA